MTSSFNTYSLDVKDIITRIEGDWQAIEPSPLGRSIWDFVLDRNLQDIYRQIFACARTEHPVSFIYRGDSPTHRQTFRMEIRSPDAAAIVVINSLLTASRRDETLDLHSEAVDESASEVQRCSVCNRFKRRGLWLDLINALTANSFFADKQDSYCTHTVCQACAERLQDAARISGGS